MSTFNGIVHEFPSIAIDWFRPHPGRRPPLACFLSHVHSDHLTGLESLRSPFVYCSAATKAMLLRLEKRPGRLACAAGTCEAPVRTYRHLRALLKPIPLDTPTDLELEPGNHIQVTLLDANHCPGAVMFLIEGHGQAILYTGDIRSEPWWVNSIARHPCLVEYSSGIKTLDRIYLDTSMLSSYALQSKAEGLGELLRKVSSYPEHTIFCMQAWTYGYEEVWITLSRALRSKIHVDRYKMGVYRSLVASPELGVSVNVHHAKEAPYLVGFSCGNVRQEGCLTLDENVRIHSCEKGTPCSVMQTRPVVWIQPIVAYLPNGNEVAEVGLGGGGDDLEQEAYVQHLNPDDLGFLTSRIDELQDLSGELRRQMKTLLLALLAVDPSSQDANTLPIDNLSEDSQARLESMIGPLVKSVMIAGEKGEQLPEGRSLPSRIRFPYARHSSYPELRHLVATFRPADIWPCTVDIAHWQERGITMEGLFGAYCKGSSYVHDQLVIQLTSGRVGVLKLAPEEDTGCSQETPGTSPCGASSPTKSSRQLPRSDNPGVHASIHALEVPPVVPAMIEVEPAASCEATVKDGCGESCGQILPAKRRYQLDDGGSGDDETARSIKTLDLQVVSQASTPTEWAYETRLDAFWTTVLNSEGAEWRSIGLISTTDNHSRLDEELGGS